jgi:hypothetical protein
LALRSPPKAVFQHDVEAQRKEAFGQRPLDLVNLFPPFVIPPVAYNARHPLVRREAHGIVIAL